MFRELHMRPAVNREPTIQQGRDACSASTSLRRTMGLELRPLRQPQQTEIRYLMWWRSTKRWKERTRLI